ncbi:hypothetical protein O988_04876 [Pseudogymnoascus sp. VKM F-3808]|nr:hypothetical protein O988_04876 [Pseudogymnoascus sp. VKM F-3808]
MTDITRVREWADDRFGELCELQGWDIASKALYDEVEYQLGRGRACESMIIRITQGPKSAGLLESSRQGSDADTDAWYGPKLDEAKEHASIAECLLRASVRDHAVKPPCLRSSHGYRELRHSFEAELDRIEERQARATLSPTPTIFSENIVEPWLNTVANQTQMESVPEEGNQPVGTGRKLRCRKRHTPKEPQRSKRHAGNGLTTPPRSTPPKQPGLRASRPAKTNPESAQTAVLLDDNARISKRKERSIGFAHEPLRRSSRLANLPGKT